MKPGQDLRLNVFSSLPSLEEYSWPDYRSAVDRVIEWTEATGMTGTLIYTDNAQPDPWVVAQYLMEHSRTLWPLVAVQPIWIHPVAAAKIISSLSKIHARPICLNLVAGGFKRELEAVGDKATHDERYRRLSEYTSVIQSILGTDDTCTFHGEYYTVDGVAGIPAIPVDCMPRLFMSGSSSAGLAVARHVGATSIVYPLPAAEFSMEALDDNWGIRVGLIVRNTSAEAWQAAFERFPKFREGELRHRLSMVTTDSEWRKQLDLYQAHPSSGVYWLEPFRSYRGNCPYLVGSVEEVAAELSRYFQLGCRTVIVSEPGEEQDYAALPAVFEHAFRRTAAAFAGGADK